MARSRRGRRAGWGRQGLGVRLPRVSWRALREGLLAGVAVPSGRAKRTKDARMMPEWPSPGFREVRLAAQAGVAPSEGSVSLVLPGGLRIEGLDLEGAAALARLLS